MTDVKGEGETTMGVMKDRVPETVYFNDRSGVISKQCPSDSSVSGRRPSKPKKSGQPAM